MASVGYMRVSTETQTLDGQKLILDGLGCERLFSDVASGSKQDRPGLEAALAFCRRGDVLVVTRLDRLARSMLHLSVLSADLKKRGVGLRCTEQAIDTTTAGGELVFNVLGAIAQFEKTLISDRTKDGLAAARASGKLGGRKAVLTGECWQGVQASIRGGMSVAAAARQAGVSRAAIYKKLERQAEAAKV